MWVTVDSGSLRSREAGQGGAPSAARTYDLDAPASAPSHRLRRRETSVGGHGGRDPRDQQPVAGAEVRVSLHGGDVADARTIADLDELLELLRAARQPSQVVRITASRRPSVRSSSMR